MTILPYITEGLRFAPDDTICQPITGMGREFKCNYNGEGPAMAIHTWRGRNLCAYHSPFDNKYVPCTRCGIKPALAPKSIEEDPVCEDCKIELARQTEMIRDFSNDEGGCPGYNDSCGNILGEGEDLCPDCTLARLDAESPREPNRDHYDYGTGGSEYYC